jgi:hypothetical protein
LKALLTAAGGETVETDAQGHQEVKTPKR